MLVVQQPEAATKMKGSENQKSDRDDWFIS